MIIFKSACLVRLYTVRHMWMSYDRKYPNTQLNICTETELGFFLLSRKWIIEAIFLSVLDYADVIYRRASASTLKLRDLVHHSAPRFIIDDIYTSHRCICSKKLGGLKM